MEDPTVRARSPGRLLRACQRSRLERQLMSEAYECLVPILTCRCDGFGSGLVDRWALAAERRNGQTARSCCAGGGS